MLFALNWVTAMCPVFAFFASDPPATQPIGGGAPSGATTPAVAASPAAASAPASGFLFKTLTLEQETYAFTVYVPPDYTPTRAWPLILFLHGSGERGDDGLLASEVGIGTAIRRHREWFPAIVVIPQCRLGKDWVGPMATMALKCVEATSREYHVDPKRLYLTGLSLGGQGVWHIAAAHPDRFAALVPVCGFVDFSEAGSRTLTSEFAP
jgi:predicted peptidase